MAAWWMSGPGLALLALVPAAARAEPIEAEAEAEAKADTRVQVMITGTKEQYRVPPERDPCGNAAGEGEIVVCALRDNERHRVSPSSSDPGSAAALRDGLPRAPQLDRGSCRGQAGCVVGGWAPPPLYIIDLKAIPEAPEGSDADKVARGEMRDR